MNLTLALAKGRIFDDILAYLERAGIRLQAEALASRRLKVADDSGRLDFILAKGADVPVYVEYGVADAGICGRDILLESDADVHQPLRLPIGECRLVVAGLVGCGLADLARLSSLRVATKYPRIAENHFRKKGIPVEIVPLSGSVELAPALGLSDCIVDIVQTGRTLEENGLVVLEEIASSSGQLIVNRASYHLKQQEIVALIGLLERAAGSGSASQSPELDSWRIDG